MDVTRWVHSRLLFESPPLCVGRFAHLCIVRKCVPRGYVTQNADFYGPVPRQRNGFFLFHFISLIFRIIFIFVPTIFSVFLLQFSPDPSSPPNPFSPASLLQSVRVFVPIRFFITLSPTSAFRITWTSMINEKAYRPESPISIWCKTCFQTNMFKTQFFDHFRRENCWKRTAIVWRNTMLESKMNKSDRFGTSFNVCVPCLRGKRTGLRAVPCLNIPLWIKWKCWCQRFYSDKSRDVDPFLEKALYRIASTKLLFKMAISIKLLAPSHSLNVLFWPGGGSWPSIISQTPTLIHCHLAWMLQLLLPSWCQAPANL